MGNEQLNASIQRFTAAIIDRTSLGYGTVAVQQTTSISAGETVNYDLATILASNPNAFDYLGTAVTLKVLDDDPASPTHNMYVSADTVMTAGVNVAGLVRVHNHADRVITYYVRLDVPHAANQ